jgi:hypothetical protein
LSPIWMRASLLKTASNISSLKGGAAEPDHECAALRLPKC